MLKKNIPPKIIFRPLTKPEVEILLTIEEEDTGPAGCFSCGDDKQDEELVNEIQFKLARGNLWAWCQVRIEVTWGGFNECQYLGCCSYENEEDFKQHSGYYDQLVDEVIDNLNQNIKKVFDQLLLRAAN